MRPSRVRRRVDANHRQIMNGLKALGYSVVSLAAVGDGCPDLLVGCWRATGQMHHPGKNVLIEIKNPAGPPSTRALTESEQKFHATWRGQVCVVHTLDEALSILR